MVGHMPLEHVIGVRVPDPQPTRARLSRSRRILVFFALINMKEKKLFLIRPKPCDLVGANFVISGWVPKAWLVDNSNTVEYRLSAEFFDISGKVFMGTSINIDWRQNWLERIFGRVYFTNIVRFTHHNIGWLEKCGGCVSIKLSGKKDTQFLYLPIIVREFAPANGVDPQTIQKLKNVGKTIEKYEADLRVYYKKREQIRNRFEHNGVEESSQTSTNIDIENHEVLWGLFEVLDRSETIHPESPYAKEKLLEDQLAEQYKDALEWRGPLAGATVARINGFELVIHSNDHGKHFHVIHKSKGVDARFSFPEIELINYKNLRNTISSKEVKRIQAFARMAGNFKKLQNEFNRRDTAIKS